MVSSAWRALTEEIARWSHAGRTAEFWWRDDDTGRSHAALDRLLALSSRTGVPVELAVVPLDADQDLFAEFGSTVSVLQHGTDHVNRAASGEKKSEFSVSEAPETALARLRRCRERLVKQAGDRFVPVLAPPWNRLPSHLVSRLASAGFAGLSQFGVRSCDEPAPGIRQVNAHVDIVAWKAGRGFVGEEQALAAAIRHLAARRSGEADPGEATGWLTHHLLHDGPAWDFLGRLFETTNAIPGVAWRRAEELFHVS